MTGLVSTPFIPISQKMGSHRGSQGIIWTQMFNEDGWDLKANISGPHYVEDFNQFDGLVTYHGNDWTGSVNLFGGVQAFPYVHNFVNFSKFKRWSRTYLKPGIYSIGIDMPDYAGMVKALLDKRGDVADKRWFDADLENLAGMQKYARTVLPRPRTKVVAGDSHTICMYRPGWDVNAVQYKTLYGALKMGLEQFVTFRGKKLSELDEVEFYFGNIDVRHHLCRQPEPLTAARELARQYYLQVAALGGGGYMRPKRVYELLPIENPRRSLPKTGHYDGTPFFGSWQDRNDVRLAFRDELLRCEKEFVGVEVVLWVDDHLLINEDGELDFKSMEVPHSVHLSRASYPWWQGWEHNHLEDPKANGLGAFL